MQIVAAALVMGVVIFAGVAVATGALNEESDEMFLSLFGVGFALLMYVMHLIVPGIVARSAAAQLSENADDLAWCGVLQTKSIIGLAMLEGAAFLNIVACMVEHNWWSLAVAGTLAVLMLIQFPTRTRVEQWIETHKTAQP